MATWLVFLPMRMPAGLVVCVLPADQLVAGMWVWSFIVDAVVAGGGIVLEVCNQPVFPYCVGHGLCHSSSYHINLVVDVV